LRDCWSHRNFKNFPGHNSLSGGEEKGVQKKRAPFQLTGKKRGEGGGGLKNKKKEMENTIRKQRVNKKREDRSTPIR